MPKYFRIVYVNTRPNSSATKDWPKDIAYLRDWTWLQTALVRWESFVLESKDSPAVPSLLRQLSAIDLLVLDWSCPNPEPSIKLYTELRETNTALPVLVVDYSPGREPVRDDRIVPNSNAIVVAEGDLGAAEVIGDSLRRLGVQLPQPVVQVDLGEKGFIIQNLIESLGDDGEKALKLIVQKFFPDSLVARVEPVGGGWSGARLVRLLIRGEHDPFFLKFFPKGKAYEDEWKQHDNAVKWLGDATVRFHPVPDLGSGFANQSEAFPPTTPCVFPVCYESASTKDHPRDTMKESYRTASEGEMETGLRKLLEILSRSQLSRPSTDDEPPWSDPGIGGFCLSRDLKESLLATLDDLAPYWKEKWDNWEHRRDALQQLVQHLPRWLTEWLPVILGHIHGDPNPRNCLIARDKPDDLRLIDCGGYRSNGRLVSDIAVVERDVKLVMMGLERQAGDFYDLDTGQLQHWYQAERNAIGHGLHYTPAQAIMLAGPYSSATRAYRLVGVVRQRACDLCGDWDSTGRHYFAALLYWTLEILQYPAVRSTKKLLALYSASEILLRT
jgi:hypothetical protein